MYRIADLQTPGKYFANGELYETKEQIVEQLADFHNIDFIGTDDKNNELEILEYFKFWEINTTKDQLDWLLDYGQWRIEKIKKGDLK